MWKGKLRKQYSSFKEFEAYDRVYKLSRRLGFIDAEDAWDANPTIQGSTKPSDYKVVKRNPRKRYKKSSRHSKARRSILNSLKRYSKRNPGKRITKVEYYRDGGTSNPKLHRKMSGGKWNYYRSY